MEAEDESDKPLAIAIVGRPNVGELCGCCSGGARRVDQGGNGPPLDWVNDVNFSQGIKTAAHVDACSCKAHFRTQAHPQSKLYH